MADSQHTNSNSHKIINVIHRTTSETLRLETDVPQKKKSTSFQITSVTVGGPGTDFGEDSTDDMDDSHTEDLSDVRDTPSYSEETYLRDDIFFNAAPDSSVLGTAPVIPTSSQYGLALVAEAAIATAVGSDDGLDIQNKCEERDSVHNRFKVVKIESTEPFRRGRWLCMDYLDHTTVQRDDSSVVTAVVSTASMANDGGAPSCPADLQFVHPPTEETVAQPNQLLLSQQMAQSMPHQQIQQQYYSQEQPQQQQAQSYAQQPIIPQQTTSQVFTQPQFNPVQQLLPNGQIVPQQMPSPQIVQQTFVPLQPTNGQIPQPLQTTSAPQSFASVTIPAQSQQGVTMPQQAFVSQPANSTQPAVVAQQQQPQQQQQQQQNIVAPLTVQNTTVTSQQLPPATTVQQSTVNPVVSVTQQAMSTTASQPTQPNQQSVVVPESATPMVQNVSVTVSQTVAQNATVSIQQPASIATVQPTTTGVALNSETAGGVESGGASDNFSPPSSTLEPVVDNALAAAAAVTAGVSSTEDGTQPAAEDADSATGTSTVAIDNKIEQAMDLVKSHLMFAVREEVEVLKEKISELMDRINQLEYENSVLKANASQETLAQLTSNNQQPQQQNPPAPSSST